MTYAALEVRRRILEATDRTLTVVNARFAKPLDEELILHELDTQPVVFTLEDHAAACGFGSAVAELAHAGHDGYVDAGRLEILGLPDRFIDHGDRTRQLAGSRLDIDSLTARVAARLNRLHPILRTAKRATGGAHR
jgi:1-deoxy-D-xylulose-5-phosphate synthase